MSEYTAVDLLDAAKKRYGETVLRNDMRGAGGDTTKADTELATIAESVIGRIRAAAQVSVGWPVAVTPNVLQRALELFRWRTLAGIENISTDQRKIGEAADAYFEDLAQGEEAWGVDLSSDVGTPVPVAARDREGNALIGTIQNRRNIFGELSGAGWDWVS